MNKYIFLIAFLFLGSSIQAQSIQSIQSILDGYDNKEQISKMELTSDVMRMFAQEYSQRRIIDKIDKIKVYIFNDEVKIKDDELKAIYSELDDDSFDQLIHVRDPNLKLDIYVSEKKEVIKELFMILLSDNKQQVVAKMKCSLTYEDFQNLDLDFIGSENLKRIGKKM